MVVARLRRFESIVVLAFAWSLILCRSALGITIRVPQDYPTITDAFVWATHGDTIVVSPAVYVENLNFGGKNLILRSTDPTSPPVVAATIIDGNQKGAVVTFNGTETTSCVLAGFTIRNGNIYGDNGGGIRGSGTRARIENNTITGNSGRYGGALYQCDGIVENNTITGNSAQYDGGGLYQCNGTIRMNTITDNSARNGGGGLLQCNGIIENNTVTGNSADDYDGGGLHQCDGTIRNNTITGNSGRYGGALYQCDGIVENNTITGNSARNGGGGLAYCTGTIRNNTISNNWANVEGGGLYGCTDGVIVNCIIWGNSAPIYSQISYHSIPAYSCIEGFTVGGGGNIGLNPLFVGPNDFHLRSGSPCIDAGTNTNCPATDMDGNPRPLDGNGDGQPISDMGAYEYVPPPPTAVPTATWILYE